jgi:hypothetical protein
LIHFSANLLLNGQVPRALDRREELAQLALLRLSQVDPLPFNLELLSEQLLDVTGVRGILPQHLVAKGAARHHLAAVHVPPLEIETLVDLRQLPHPIVGEPKLGLQQRSQAHPEPLLELLAIHPAATDSLPVAPLRAAHR